MADWRANLVERDEDVSALLRECRRVAVLGCKPDSEATKPGHAVPAYLLRRGYEIIPVPVKDPGGPTILGQRVYRTVAEVPGEVDVVQVFRRPEHIPPHLPDLLEKCPRAVWFQLGIRNEAAAEQLARAGIRVVQDRCMKIEHHKLEG